ncbi:MAG: plastocyanin/azurin family copper-binding protein [Ignavibacteriales bacterium]|nr:plastocyanin/azurin family copper-binding protein [Ignavibacteriales bacterium]
MKTQINFAKESFLVMLLFFVIGIVGCSKNDSVTNPYGNGGNTTPGADEVWMQGSAFNPRTKTVAVGTTVTWTNKDGVIHTVTSGIPGTPDGLFNSGNLSQGGVFSHKFDSKGTFKYYCIPHQSFMTATIIVQ